MAPGQNGRQHQFDHAFLPEHNLPDLGAHLRQQLDGGVGFLDDIGRWGDGDFTHTAHLPIFGANPEAELPMSNAIAPNATSLADLISTLQVEAGLEKPRSLPPVHLWNPTNCGDIGLHIRRDGSWWQEGVRFSREKLVRLFSTILRRDADGYFLVTPHEKVVVKVDDAPFVGVRVDRHESDGHQVILVTTNVGDVVAVDEAHPIRVVTNRQTGEPSTYVLVRGGLEARLARPPYYELISWAEPDQVGMPTMSVMSSGVRFRVGEAA